MGDADDINSLLDLLPPDDKLRRALSPYTRPGCSPYLVDLAADLGRPITLRLSDKSCRELHHTLDLTAALNRLEAAAAAAGGKNGSNAHQQVVTARTTRARSQAGAQQPAAVAAGGSSSGSGRRGLFFSDVNRLGVPGSLHRISAMRDRGGEVYGLTYRVGRHVPGVADLLADVLSSMRDAARGTSTSSSSSSLLPVASPGGCCRDLLLLGRPGVGKTTLLRDVARLMSSPVEAGGLGMVVIIVDTSNEVAGDCDQPHPCIGGARRMMVPHRHQQAAVMMEAVMNHAPDVIIVDEIATKEEAAACRTISSRGVLLISTAHGSSLSDLLRNPDLQGLAGGVKPVTLGDRTAAEHNRGHKTRLERGGAVTFGTLVEILDTNKWRLHPDVAASVDTLLKHSTSSSTAGGSTTDLDVPPTTPPGANTQLRSRSTPEQGSKLLVCFESGQIPSTAAWVDGPGPSAWGVAQPVNRQQQQQQQYLLEYDDQQQQQQQRGRKRGRDWVDNSPGPSSHQQQQQQQQPKRLQQQQPAKKKAKQQQQRLHQQKKNKKKGISGAKRRQQQRARQAAAQGVGGGRITRRQRQQQQQLGAS